MSEMKQVVMVTSVPKSGTHFLGVVLEKIGINHSGIFAINPSLAVREVSSRFGSNRHSGFYLAEGYSYFYENLIDIKIESLVNVLTPGSFFLSHMTPRDLPFYLLPRLKIIFIKRNLIDTLLSGFHAEMLVDSLNRDRNFLENYNLAFLRIVEEEMMNVREQKTVQKQFHQYLKNVLPQRLPHVLDLLYWQNYKHVHFIDYESLLAPDAASGAIINLGEFLGMKLPSHEAANIASAATQSPTPTKLPTELIPERAVWDETCQNLYEQHRMPHLQVALDKLSPSVE
jgi:Sulfotransferase domain